MAVHLAMIPVRWLVDVWERGLKPLRCPDCREFANVNGDVTHKYGCEFKALLDENTRRNERTAGPRTTGARIAALEAEAGKPRG